MPFCFYVSYGMLKSTIVFSFVRFLNTFYTSNHTGKCNTHNMQYNLINIFRGYLISYVRIFQYIHDYPTQCRKGPSILSLSFLCGVHNILPINIFFEPKSLYNSQPSTYYVHPPYFLSLCRLFRRLFSCIITYFLIHYLCIR